MAAPVNDPFASPFQPPLGMVVEPMTLRQFYIGCSMVGMLSNTKHFSTPAAKISDLSIAQADATILKLSKPS